MKFIMLLVLGFTIFSCDFKSNSLENNYSERESMKNKLTKEEALEKAKTILLKQKKEIAEKLKVIDHDDYYTVTPDLPPFTLGGGWSVDLNSYSGKNSENLFYRINHFKSVNNIADST